MASTKAEGYEVKQVRGIPRYLGMNKAAAKELHEPYHHKAHTVVVEEEMSPKNRKLTAQHEIDENKLMAKKHMHYPEAHERATKMENFGLKRRIGNKPLSSEIRLKHSRQVRSSRV